MNERGDVTFRWVKGHSGDPMNDLVDSLAVEASRAVPTRPAAESVAPTVAHSGPPADATLF